MWMKFTSSFSACYSLPYRRSHTSCCNSSSKFLKIWKSVNITIFEERKLTILLSPCFYVKEIFTMYMSDIDYKVDILQICVQISAIWYLKVTSYYINLYPFMLHAGCSLLLQDSCCPCCCCHPWGFASCHYHLSGPGNKAYGQKECHCALSALCRDSRLHVCNLLW